MSRWLTLAAAVLILDQLTKYAAEAYLLLHQPVAVLADMGLLRTLPAREFAAGVAEVVKYGVILDEEFFAYLEQNVEKINNHDAETLSYVVQRCCRLKADVVEQDEREITGLRAVLNYGHTFAHAFEAAGQYKTHLHGEAVSIGMMCAARLAARMGRVDNQFVDRQQALLEALSLPIETPNYDGDELVKLMRRDKKVDAGQLRFILPDRMGHVELVADVRIDDVLASLKS